jgi:hypothetical protein
VQEQEGKEEDGEQPPREADRDLGHADWSSRPGALERVKESAAHAMEGVKMHLHLGTHQPSAEERTGG